MWLLGAWGRFRKSKSSTWCNEMRFSSRLYVLEFKSNLGGKFLERSVSKRVIELFSFPEQVGMIRVGLESLNPSLASWVSLL